MWVRFPCSCVQKLMTGASNSWDIDTKILTSNPFNQPMDPRVVAMGVIFTSRNKNSVVFLDLFDIRQFAGFFGCGVLVSHYVAWHCFHVDWRIEFRANFGKELSEYLTVTASGRVDGRERVIGFEHQDSY